MPTNIETLKKLIYTNLEDLLQDLNRNFAVIASSPLYKGIPGEPGESAIGEKGTRGSKFIFVNLLGFQEAFENEIIAGSNINLSYINSKLFSFESKQLLLTALNVTELVDKDIIVLTNSAMLTYDFETDKFIDSGVAFNEQTNLLTNIEKKIEDYIALYFKNNQTIDSTDIFGGFASYAKNFADNNNTQITTALTPSSIYAPYIPGFNNTNGIALNNHKYFGFNDNVFPRDNNGTIVFGSIKKYYELLQQTILTDGKESLSSDYSPGVGNIPSSVFLQDTYNNGLMFGYKNKTNLKRFASIFKNEIDELIIKSDSGKNESESSSIVLHRDYLKYAKLAQFGNDVEISRDLKSFGDLLNKGIRTGKYTDGANFGNSYNSKVTEIGLSGTESLTKLVSEYIECKTYLDNVLVTNEQGRVVKNFKIEKTILNENEIPDLTRVVTRPSNTNNLITSNYIDFALRKINAISTYIENNYWRKDQFGTTSIQDLSLGNNLSVRNSFNLSQILTGVNILGDRYLTINANEVTDNSEFKRYTNFKNVVFVTNSSGALVKSYSIEKSNLDYTELNDFVKLNIFSESPESLLSSKYYGHLAKKINAIIDELVTKYYSRANFLDFSIETLNLNDSLEVRGSVVISDVFSFNKLTKDLRLGTDTSNIRLKTSNIFFNKFIGKVLVTDNDGKLMNVYAIENSNYPEEQVLGDAVISDILNSQTRIVRSSHLSFISRKINSLIDWIKNTYWNKAHFDAGTIPNLKLSNDLTVNGDVIIGELINPNISTSGGNTTIGKIASYLKLVGNTINFDGRRNKVIVTNTNGDVRNDIELETLVPNHVNVVDILNNYWLDETQAFDNVANSANKILTSNFFSYITNTFLVIRTLLFNRPTYTELDTALQAKIIGFKGEVRWIRDLDYTFMSNFDSSGKGLPNKKFAKFAICNGNYGTDNMAGRSFIGPGLCVDTNGTPNIYYEGTKGGELSHVLTVDEMPSHTHKIQTTQSANSSKPNVDPMRGSITGGDSGRGTDSTGNNQPHNNMSPYVVAWPIMQIVD